MVDGFLRSHRLARRAYSITGRISSASLRDQCVRAEMIAKRLAKAKGLDETSKVVIVGSGISAGVVAAAFCKLPHAPQVVLCSSSSVFANKQQECVYRYIDPFVYDWPHTHFEEKTYPLRGQTAVSWTADRSDRVFSGLDKQLRDYLEVHPQFFPEYFREVNAASYDVNAKDEKWRIRLRSLGENNRVNWRVPYRKGDDDILADLLLVCGGVHHECDWIGTKAQAKTATDKTVDDRSRWKPKGEVFRSYCFWDVEDDLFTKPPDRFRRVLVVGAGDGVLQDFFYLLTGKGSIRDILDAIPIKEAIQHRLQSIQSAYLRSYIASVHSEDHQVFADAQAEIEKLCDEVWEEADTRQRFIDQLLRYEVCPEVQIACRCWHLDHSFPANRFVCNLLARAVRARYARLLREFRQMRKQGIASPAPRPLRTLPFRMAVSASSFDSLAPAGTKLTTAEEWAAYPVRIGFTATHNCRDNSVQRPARVPRTHIHDTSAAVFDRVLLRIGAPPVKSVVRSYRAIDHAIGWHLARANPNILSEVRRGKLPSIADRDVRQAPPFFVPT